MYMTLGEVEIEKGDFDSAVEAINECLKYRTQFYPEHSRDIADALYYLGLAQYSSAENNALLSEDDATLVAKAKESAKASLESFKKTQLTLCHVCLDLALKEKLITKKGSTLRMLLICRGGCLQAGGGFEEEGCKQGRD